MSIKLLGRQSLIYGFGHILTRLVTFLLLPLYTNRFSPEQYGIVALFYTFVPMLNVVMRYGMGAAFLKNYVPARGDDRKAVMTNVITSLIVTGIPFMFLWYSSRGVLAPVLFGVDEPNYVTIMGAIIFLDSIWSIPMLSFRSENRPILFISFSLINVGITIAFNLFFILGLNMGIEGIFYSNLIASGSLFILNSPFIVQRFHLPYLSIEKWKTIFAFALPFLPAGLFAMAMEVADRYILKLLMDLSTVGIYNAGYKVGILVSLFVNGFNMGWQPYFLEKGKDKHPGNLFGRVNTIVLGSLGFIWLCLLLWADDLIQLNIAGYMFFGEKFHASLPIIPWIALGYYFYGFYILQTPGIFLKNRPKYAALTRFIGALSNIGLCFLLIPKFEALGAAYATCASFLIMALLMYGINTRLYPIHLEWKKIGIILFSLIVGYALFDIFNDSLIVNIAITFLYPFCLIGFGIVNLHNVKTMFSSEQ
jgi:O-antigen/teichoic acid export membrane protein